MKRAERLYRQGQSYLSQGERNKAAEKFEESLELSRMIAFKPGIAHNLNEMAIIHTTHGEFAKAREILSESLEIYKELDMAPEVSKTLNNIVVTYAKAGRFREALAKYEQLLDWDGETGNRLGQAITLNNMGLIYQNHLRDAEKAREKYTEALQIFQDLGENKYVRSVERNLGTLESQPE
jgi:tetratricopeptide (TPR) repeat protein